MNRRHFFASLGLGAGAVVAAGALGDEKIRISWPAILDVPPQTFDGVDDYLDANEIGTLFADTSAGPRVTLPDIYDPRMRVPGFYAEVIFADGTSRTP